MSSLLRDERGAAYVEMLIAFPVVLLSFLGAFMFAYLSAAHLVVERSASAAARAASVIMADTDARYPGGNAQRLAFVREAARRVLLASPGISAGSLAVSVSGNQAGFAPLTASVRADFDCSMFVVSVLCGADGKVTMHAESAMSYQGI